MKPHGFHHRALIYADEAEFLSGTLSFLREALEAGEPTLVAVRGENRTMLEGELGADATAVSFAAMEEAGRNPAWIIPLWREFVDAAGGRSVRGVGEPLWPGRDPAEIEECQRHESLLNVAFAPRPCWSLLCPYDGARLDDDVLAAVGCSHSTIERAGALEPSSAFDPLRDAFDGELPPPRAAVETIGFGLGDLALVRAGVRRIAERAGLGSGRITDLVTAAGELAANSVVHGGGRGTLRLWLEDDRVVAEVEDRGRIEEPLVGRLRPGVTQKGGRGLWLANQLCDLIQIRSGDRGTTVRLRVAPEAG